MLDLLIPWAVTGAAALVVIGVVAAGLAVRRRIAP